MCVFVSEALLTSGGAFFFYEREFKLRLIWSALQRQLSSTGLLYLAALHTLHTRSHTAARTHFPLLLLSPYTLYTPYTLCTRRSGASCRRFVCVTEAHQLTFSIGLLLVVSEQFWKFVRVQQHCATCTPAPRKSQQNKPVKQQNLCVEL